MSNELSELQAVDFAIGGFISAAFDDLSTTTGPKEWREFLGRATAAQVYRHDAASPGDFLKALQSSRKAETGPAADRMNAPTLPAVYYFRKPGFSNVNDRSKQLRKSHAWNDDLSKTYNLRMLHLDLDYTIVFVAWDKPTLDKLCMAWYAYIVSNDVATAKFQIGAEVIDVPVFVQDHCNLTITDSSEPAENGRLFAATTNYTMHTLVMFGAEVPPPPETIGIQYGLSSTFLNRVIAGYGDGIQTLFEWDALSAYGKDMTIVGAGIYLDGVLIARWDGTQWIPLSLIYTVTGLIILDRAFFSVKIVPPPPYGYSVVFCMDTGVIIVGAGCTSCHDYSKDGVKLNDY